VGFAFYRINIHLGSNPLPVFVLILLSAIAQMLIYYFVIALVFLILRSVGVATSSILRKRIPDAIFVDQLLQALETASMPDRLWGELSTRDRLMRQLEEAARIVDEEMPRALRPFDSYTDSWERTRFGEIAASLRAKKQWVCMPKSDTRDRLQEALTTCFVDAAFGRWDGLETAENRPKGREILLRGRIFLQGIIVALSPAALLFVARHLGYFIDEQFSRYLDVSVVLWAVIGILFVIDPRFSEKVEAAQKLGSFIPGLSKKKEI